MGNLIELWHDLHVPMRIGRRARSAILALCAVGCASPAFADSSKLVTTPDAFLAGCRADIAAARKAIDQFKAAGPGRSAVETLDLYDDGRALLADAGARANLTWGVHPDEAMRNAGIDCESEVEAATTELSLDRALYDALARLDVSQAEAPVRHYVERTLAEYRRNGVDRDEATRDRLRRLRDEMVTLGQQFESNVASDVRTLAIAPRELAGLPDDFARAHPPGPDGKVSITTNATDYAPFLTYATSATAREALWKLNRQRGHPANLEVLRRLLAVRYEFARLLGFDTWADYITDDKMIGNAASVAAFITKISEAADARMRSDYDEVLDQKRREIPGATAVDAWDSAFYQEQVKAAAYDFDSQLLRPYFEYSRVKQGVMDLTSRMFGITYRRVTDAVVWHEDVEAYDVFDGETRLGRIYLDMFPRDDKYTHFAQFTLVNGNAGNALPESVLVCNFPRPGGAEPALMLHADVEAFFHEWGHLLHQIFQGQTRWEGLAEGPSEWDFVEAPSQMFEEWVWDPATLQTFARHYLTDAPIPADLVARMKRADEFGKGLFVRQQMFYAAVSLELYRRNPEGLDTSRVVEELQERFTPFAFVDGTYFEASFTHLDGYSAIYYGYMWSLVIAKDMFTVFQQQGLLDPATADRYRDAVLAPGGSRPAADLVEDFLGRPYDFAAYAAWLAN
ncbi:MAG: M3 family metallopeptidase [Vicinamibacterales bacterium]